MTFTISFFSTTFADDRPISGAVDVERGGIATDGECYKRSCTHTRCIDRPKCNQIRAIDDLARARTPRPPNSEMRSPFDMLSSMQGPVSHRGLFQLFWTTPRDANGQCDDAENATAEQKSVGRRRGCKRFLCVIAKSGDRKNHYNILSRSNAASLRGSAELDRRR